MATLRKRGPYQWEAGIRKRGYPTTCKTFDTKVEAEAWAKDVETNMNKSLFVSAKEAEQYTLGECLDRYIEEYIPRLKLIYLSRHITASCPLYAGVTRSLIWSE